MDKQTADTGTTQTREAAVIDLVIQIGCLALLSYWTFVLVLPFSTIIVWSVILAVVLYPAFTWMVRVLRFPGIIAALFITIVCLGILLGPVAWLGLSLIETVRSLAERIGAGDIAVPPPPTSVKSWPLIGSEIYGYWSLASINFKAALLEIAPELKPIRNYLLEFASSTAIGMIKFVTSIVISGFLLLPGPSFVGAARRIFHRIAAGHGDEFLDLIGVTIRNLARGVIGISFLQALLAGVGLIVAGVPGAGLLSFLILLLGIVQIDALIIILPLIAWAWLKMDFTTALVFTVYMIPIGVLNNILRPFVLAHGLKTPTLVIFVGVIGGILAHGVIGLFVGPIVLAIGWELLMSWLDQARASREKPADLPTSARHSQK